MGLIDGHSVSFIPSGWGMGVNDLTSLRFLRDINRILYN